MNKLQENFYNARGAVQGTSALQSRSVTLPGGGGAPMQTASMTFPPAGQLSPPAASLTSQLGVAQSGAAQAPPAASLTSQLGVAQSGAAQAPPLASPDASLNFSVSPASGPQVPAPAVDASQAGAVAAQAPPPPSVPADLPQTSSMSSLSTPEIPSFGVGASAAPAGYPDDLPPPAMTKSLPRRTSWLDWIRHHRRTFILALALLGFAVVLFIITYMKTRSSGGGSGGGGGKSGGGGARDDSKDFTVRLAQGSTLELQGLGGASPAGSSQECSSLKGAIDDLSRQQKAITQELERLVGKSGCDGDPDCEDAEGLKRNELRLTRPSKLAQEPQSAGKVHYSSQLSAQVFGEPPPPAPQGGRWVQPSAAHDGGLRAYGSTRSADMVYSTFAAL